MTTTDVDSGVYYDMYDPAIYADPYPVYKRLREEAPLYRNEAYDFYAVSRFEDVARVMSDRATFISSKGGVYNILSADVEIPLGLFIFEDAPLHTIHRNLVSRVFTPKRVAELEPKIRALCAQLADGLVGRERFDFMHDFANELPMRVIGMLAGVPEADQPGLRDTYYRFLHEETSDPNKSPLEGLTYAESIFGPYLDYRVEHPSDDLITALQNVEFEDEKGVTRRLERHEVCTYLNIIATGGSDTTSTMIGWAGKLLGEHPDQRRAVAADPSLVHGTIEEVLRFEPPPYHFGRSVAVDVEIHGQTVPEGSMMIVLPASANRDERKWENPDVFDVTRKPGQILSFGFGSHFCVGASLARMEGRLAIEELLKKVPDWTPVPGEAQLAPGTDTRSLATLPVTVG